MARIAWFGAFLFACAASAFAQAAPPFLIERWTTADGLPVNGVNQVHVGRSGHLWLITFDGLVRFDGHRFTTFVSGRHPGLPGNRLVHLAETADGLLWVLNDTGQLSSFDGERFREHGRADGLPSERLFSLQVDGEGVLWAYTYGGAARRAADGRFEAFSDDPRLGLVGFVDRAPDGALWAASTTGVHRFEGGRRVRSYGAAEGAPEPTFYFAWDARGRLWLPGQDFVARLEHDGSLRRIIDDTGAARVETAGDLVAILGGTVDFTQTGDGPLQRRERGPGLRIANRERLLGRAPDGSLWRNRVDALERDGETVFASSCSIADFDFDASAQVWIASTCEGLVRLRPRRIDALTEVGGERLGSVYGLAESAEGDLWIATVDRGVAVQRRDGTSRWLRGSPALTMASRKPVWIGADGETWIGGCRVEAGDRCEPPSGLPPALARSNEIQALHRARDGSFWIGGRSLWQRTPSGEWRPLPAAAGLHDDEAGQVRVVAEDPHGTLWFGTRGRGLLRRDARGELRRFSRAEGLASESIRALRQDRDGALWIGTEDRGLCRMLDPASAAPRIACLGRERGLWSDSLHQLIFDDDGRLWINSNHGVFALRRAALEAVLDGRAERVHPQVYTERDGLPDREGNGGVSDAGIRLRDGRIAFPTVRGIALFDPRELQPAAAPARAVFESLELPSGQSLAAAARVALERGERSFVLRYTGLTAALTAPLYFRYRLLPDSGWIELGESRQLSLSRLPAGEHVLELQAFDSSGEPGPPARITLELPPFFHETTAFRIALPALLAALFALWLLRQRRLALVRRQQLERTVAERTDDLRRALDTVSRQRNEIEELAAGKARFFANISHELRTPLTLISGPLHDAGDESPLAPQTRRLMRANAQRLERLVEQLLDLERIDAGRFPLRPDTGDLAALAQDLVQSFTPLAHRQGIDLAAAAVAPVWLRFDADQIARLLGNLLSNALKFTPRGGRIELALHEDAQRVCVSVSDDGPGVPPEWRERIFDRFAQVGSEALRSREGAGLGLALCREIAQLHEGRLWVEERAGGGACFVLELPRSTGLQPAPAVRHAQDEPSIRTPPDAADLPHPLASEAGEIAEEPPPLRRRVLVAEDHPDLRAYIASILGADYDLLEAADGERALELARSELPDLIVSDVMMPRRDGLAFARALRADAQTAGIPLIFLTARASQEDEIAGLRSGADQYLRKPFDAALLRSHAAAALHAVDRLRRRFEAGAGAPAADVSAGPRLQGTAAEQRFALAVREWIQAHLHEEDASVQRMADALHVSRATLARRYARSAGETPIDALRRQRLERARGLLARAEGNVSEVAYAVGYASLAAFSSAYRERYGHAPSRTAEPEPLAP